MYIVQLGAAQSVEAQPGVAQPGAVATWCGYKWMQHNQVRHDWVQHKRVRHNWVRNKCVLNLQILQCSMFFLCLIAVRISSLGRYVFGRYFTTKNIPS
jgi:hypothetical protein